MNYRFFLLAALFLGSIIIYGQNNNTKKLRPIIIPNNSGYTEPEKQIGVVKIDVSKLKAEDLLRPSEAPGYSTSSGYNKYGKSQYDEQQTSAYFETPTGSKRPLFEDVRETNRNNEIKKYVIIFIVSIFVILLLLYFIYWFDRQDRIPNQKNISKKSFEKPEIELKDIAFELEKINELKTKGIITEEEFLKLKERIIK